SMSRSRVRERVARLLRSRATTLCLLTLLMVPVGVASGASLTLSSKALTVYATCTLSGSAGTSASVQDSYVDQNAPTTNSGAAATMPTQSRKNRNQRPYVFFDLTTCSPAVPVSAVVTNATLRLYATALPGTCETEDAFRVTSSWTENGITWNNQPFGTAVNNPASGSRTDSATVGTGAGCGVVAAGYVSWDVTTDVSAFVSGASTNRGWMVRDDVEDTNGLGVSVTFSSSDAGSVPQAPQLIVTYRR